MTELFYGVGAHGLLGRMARLVGGVPRLWASNGPRCVAYLFALPYSNISFQRSQPQGRVLSEGKPCARL